MDRGLTINLTQCSIQVKGNKAVKWSKGSLKRELKNQLKKVVK